MTDSQTLIVNPITGKVYDVHELVLAPDWNHCGTPIRHRPTPTVIQRHHILPISWGGDRGPQTPLCGSCHDSVHGLLDLMVHAFRNWNLNHPQPLPGSNTPLPTPCPVPPIDPAHARKLHFVQHHWDCANLAWLLQLPDHPPVFTLTEQAHGDAIPASHPHVHHDTDPLLVLRKNQDEPF